MAAIDGENRGVESIRSIERMVGNRPTIDIGRSRVPVFDLASTWI
jgi:hypothetical protein